MFESQFHYKSKDFALAEFVPYNMKDLNALFEVCDSTYYFSLAAAVPAKNKMKQREILSEPKRLSSMGAGFDLDVDRNLYFTE